MLDDEANTQNSDLHASVIEIDSNIQQPPFRTTRGVLEGGLGGAQPPLLKFEVKLGGLSPSL